VRARKQKNPRDHAHTEGDKSVFTVIINKVGPMLRLPDCHCIAADSIHNVDLEKAVVFHDHPPMLNGVTRSFVCVCATCAAANNEA
jgi:hypothetical protein